MPPLQQPQPDDTDILIDAIMDQNSKLDDIAQTNDIQVEAIAESNAELNELNRTADIIVDMISKKMDQVQEVKLVGASIEKIKGEKGDTPVKGKDYFTKEEIADVVKEVQDSIRIPEDGIDGEDGYTPIKGKDYFTSEEIEEIIQEAVLRIPVPKDGEDGEDGKDADPVDYNLILKEVKKLIPQQKEFKKDTPAQIKAKLLKVGISYDEIKDAPIWKPGSSKTVSLTELDDVDYSGLSIVDSKYVLGSGGSSQDLQAVTDLGSTTTNNITANSFITTGGTSADFVKGDGSLDSTTYLSTSTASSTYVPYTGATSAVDLGSNNFTVDTNTLFVDATNNRTGLLTTAPTHTLTLGSTSTGIALYNTADQVTNYERANMYWSSNVFTIENTQGGTGSNRSIRLRGYNGAATADLTIRRTTNPFFAFDHSSTSATGNFLDVTGTTASTSGTYVSLALRSTINQSSTAGYTALLINPTETATGSGTKRLISAQVGGSDRFSVDNTGQVGIVKLATASTREMLFKATVSDATTDFFFINNGTITDGRMIPLFGGIVNTNTVTPHLQFAGFVTEANDASDSSNFGLVDFTAFRTSSSTDPANGTLTDVVNRKLFTWRSVTGVKMTMPANGSLGLGTTPTARFHISHDTSADYIQIERTGANAGGWKGLITHSGATNYGSIFWRALNATSDFAIQDSSSNTIFYLDTSAGALGLGGITAPTEELDLLGTFQAKAKSGADNTWFRGINSAGTTVGEMKEASTVGGGGLLFNGVRSASGGNGIFFGGYTPSNGNAAIEFRGFGGTIASPTALTTAPVAKFSKYDGANTVDLMTIDVNGNVGVGTTNPSAKLHLSDGNTPAAALIPSGPALISSKQSSNNDFYLITAGVSGATNSGVFGTVASRGTLSSPTAVATGDALLRLVGAGYDGSVSQYAGRIYFEVDGSVSSGVVPTAITFRTGNSSASQAERLRINSSGNVGIGTTPVSKLHVYQNDTEVGSGAGITIEQDSTGDAILQYVLTSTRRWVSGIDNSDSDKYKISPVLDLSNAVFSMDITGAATFAGDVTVPDEAYGAGWNGSLEVPTKNAVYDQIQTIVASSTANTYNEVPTGLINSSNTVYTTAANFATAKIRVYLNGLRQTLGTDYTETAANQITFTTAPTTGDILVVDYQQA